MFLSDFVDPHLDGVDLVVDANAEALPLAPYLSLPSGVRLVRLAEGDDGEPFGPGVLVIAVVGPHPKRHGDAQTFTALTRRLRPGARCVLVFGQQPAELPYFQILDAIAATRGVVSAPSTLDYQHLHAAIAFTCGDGPESETRARAEQLLAQFVGVAVQNVLQRAALDPRLTRSDRSPKSIARWKTEENAKLKKELQRSEDRVRSLRRKVAELESSASMRLGKLLIGIAKNPRVGARELPRELYRLWKVRGQGPGPALRGGTKSMAKPGKAKTGQPPVKSVEGGPTVTGSPRWLAHTAVDLRPRDVPVVAGIVTTGAALALRGPGPDPSALVNRLLPHDALAVIEATDPDLLLIESSALLAPSPWAHALSGAMVSRDVALREAVIATRALGRPVVVWWTSPPDSSPGLDRLAATADLVLDFGEWTLGGMPPPDAGDAQRAWFRSDALPVRLAELCTRLRLRQDPLAVRRVSVLARAAGAEESTRLCGQLLGQSHRPAQLVLAGPELDASQVRELEDAGLRVMVVPPDLAWDEMRGHADAPWLLRWDAASDPSPDHLLDLLAAAEAHVAPPVPEAAPKELIP